MLFPISSDVTALAFSEFIWERMAEDDDGFTPFSNATVMFISSVLKIRAASLGFIEVYSLTKEAMFSCSCSLYLFISFCSFCS